MSIDYQFQNLVDKNRDLLEKFKSLNLKAYDLQRDFYAATVDKGEEISDFYWDKHHYVEKGHSLAADVLYQYLVSEDGFFSQK